MLSNEYSPLDIFNLARRRWWIIAILVLVGGLLGGLFSRLHAPVYDAKALLVINIDYEQAPELVQRMDDHYVEDHIIGAANAVVVSTYVLDQVGAELLARGISVDWSKVVYNLSAERRRSQFWLRVRDTDPDVAAVVANLWAERAYAALVESHQHAVKAQVLRDYLDALSACPQPPAITPSPPSICDAGLFSDIQLAIEAVTAQMGAETVASNGLVPVLTFSLAQKAVVPVTPVAYRASLLLAVGALFGLIVGVVAVQVNYPATGDRSKRSHEA